MSKVLENRKSSFSLAAKKEIELTHLLSLAYVCNTSLVTLLQHNLYKCTFACHTPSNEAYYRNSLDIACEDVCYLDFLKVQKALASSSDL